VPRCRTACHVSGHKLVSFTSLPAQTPQSMRSRPPAAWRCRGRRRRSRARAARSPADSSRAHREPECRVPFAITCLRRVPERRRRPCRYRFLRNWMLKPACWSWSGCRCRRRRERCRHWPRCSLGRVQRRGSDPVRHSAALPSRPLESAAATDSARNGCASCAHPRAEI